MHYLLVNIICALTLSNASPDVERAQQTLDSLTKTMQHPTRVCYVRTILLTKTIRQLIWHQKNKQKDAMNIPTFGRIRAHSLQ